MLTTLTLTLILAQPKELEIKLDPLVEMLTAPNPADTPLRKLQKERCRARAAAHAKMEQIIAIGRWDSTYFERCIHLQVALAANLAELAEKPADKLRCLELGTESLREFEKFIARRVEVGSQPSHDLDLAKATRIDAEIELLKLKDSLKGK